MHGCRTAPPIHFEILEYLLHTPPPAPNTDRMQGRPHLGHRRKAPGPHGEAVNQSRVCVLTCLCSGEAFRSLKANNALKLFPLTTIRHTGSMKSRDWQMMVDIGCQLTWWCNQMVSEHCQPPCAVPPKGVGLFKLKTNTLELSLDNPYEMLESLSVRCELVSLGHLTLHTLHGFYEVVSLST